MRFMAMARVSCASLLMEPNDMAPVVKRLTISLAGSTSSIGTGLALFFNFIKLRNVAMLLLWLSMRSVYSWKVWKFSCRTALLQFADGQRIEQVILAVDALVICAPDGQFGLGFGQRTEGVFVLHLRFAGEHFEADAFQARGGAGEIRVHQPLVQADGFEHLRSLIALQGRDAHLGERFQQSFVHGLDEVLRGKFGSHAIRQFAATSEVFRRSPSAR